MSATGNQGDEGVGDGSERFEDRQLCPDGACTGLLGADGRCRECGRTADGAPPEPSGEPAAALELSADDEQAGSDEDEERRLCPDGSCVGLLGADGRCRVCGLAGDAAAP